MSGRRQGQGRKNKRHLIIFSLSVILGHSTWEPYALRAFKTLAFPLVAMERSARISVTLGTESNKRPFSPLTSVTPNFLRPTETQHQN